jgi:hypothetical protein
MAPWSGLHQFIVMPMSYRPERYSLQTVSALDVNSGRIFSADVGLGWKFRESGEAHLPNVK